MAHLKLSRALALCLFFIGLASTAPAQVAQGERVAGDNPLSAIAASTNAKSDLDEIRRQLREQQEELRRLRTTVNEQSRVIDELRQRVEQTSTGASVPTIVKAVADGVGMTTGQQASTGKGQAQDVNARIANVEEQVKKTNETIARQLGSITFSGDLRLRYESFYGQLNTLANAANPAIVGNELSPRQRFRMRARLDIRGKISKEFEWGIRFTSGSYADAISGNLTLTDFFDRKPFGLDNAYIAYSPNRVAGLRLQGGKFDVPWLRTEMTIDNDIMPEGFNETYSRGFKKSTLKNLTFVAWQLPFLERNSAFVRNGNGTVNVDESRRAGRDLALYGAQLRARFEPASKIGLTLALADLYYSGTQFITPIQFFGNQLQLPLTVTIPATANSPAQTVTGLATISRDLLVAGQGNLGISTASNNSVNRDGRLSSGFNLVDFITRMDITRSQRFPVALIFDFVTNTQTRDVVTARPGGADLFLPNNENKGFWAEAQVGRQKEKGDLLFDYTFVRIQKDAVLTPFNFSDLVQQSDVRVQRFTFNYTVDPRVVFSIIGFVLERPNGLLGAFGSTPPGSLNRPTTRIQFDTTFRF